MVVTLQSCGNEVIKENKTNHPLQAAYAYFDELDQSEFRFANLERRLNVARGANNVEESNAIVKEYKTAQTECIKKLETKFPAGTIQIPFEQIAAKDTLTVKSVYLSGFWFPWNTASIISLKFTVEYEVVKKDVWFAKVPVTFYDSENDILGIISAPCNETGKTMILVRANNPFRILSKVVIQ